jgi:alpha-galactosidase
MVVTVAPAQQTQVAGDSLVVSNQHVRVVANLHSGVVHYRFTSGTQLENTTAYVEDVKTGYFSSTSLSRHSFTTDNINDPLGKGICINLVHEAADKPVKLVQYITIYESQPFLLLTVEASGREKGSVIETRNISPLTVLPAQQGKVVLPGSGALFTDYPFDNDNWVDVISRRWPADQKGVDGISYELASAYDENSRNGFAVGSLVHDFWKTGIRYATGVVSSRIDSFLFTGTALGWKACWVTKR